MELLEQLSPRALAELSLFLNGLIIVLLMAFALRFLRQRSSSEFRDDLWNENNLSHEERETIKRVIDQIALGAPGDDDEITKKVARESLATDEVTAPGPARKMHQKAPQEASPYRNPNFRGRPHEVLGIPADANVDLIQAAYKYWIKRFHPDRVQHLGPGYAQEAHRRTEALNAAKIALLSKVTTQKH